MVGGMVVSLGSCEILMPGNALIWRWYSVQRLRRLFFNNTRDTHRHETWGPKRSSENRMTQNDKQEWKKLYIQHTDSTCIYTIYHIYKEIYYAALWQCLMMERKPKKCKTTWQKQGRMCVSVCVCVGCAGVSLDPDKAATTTTTACHKSHQSFWAKGASGGRAWSRHL